MAGPLCRVSAVPQGTADTQNRLAFSPPDGVVRWGTHLRDAGLERFKGKYFHSREYKHPDGFQGKRVLVVGIGNSGVDIATELSRSARKVFLSTRRGAWVLSRLTDHGYPWDSWFTTRFKTLMRKWIPCLITNQIIEMYLNHRFDHSNYGLQRNSSVWKEPMFSDDLPVCIIRGSVVIKPGVQEFSENSVKFEDGTLEDIDVVIFATGYHYSFPYLEESVIKFRDHRVSLYWHVFPPDLEKPTLAFIGLIEPLGTLLATAEMQTRWATRVFKGLNKLPSLEKIKEDLSKKTKEAIKRCGNIQGNILVVDFIQYIDEIASEIRVKPNIFCLLLTDPDFLWTLHIAAVPSDWSRKVGWSKGCHSNQVGAYTKTHEDTGGETGSQ